MGFLWGQNFHSIVIVVPLDVSKSFMALKKRTASRRPSQIAQMEMNSNCLSGGGIQPGPALIDCFGLIPYIKYIYNLEILVIFENWQTFTRYDENT
jgi:hypothetical protein